MPAPALTTQLLVVVFFDPAVIHARASLLAVPLALGRLHLHDDEQHQCAEKPPDRWRIRRQ
jgi:hypothetical protein